MKRYYYRSTIDAFLVEDRDSIFGQLAIAHQHDLEDLQKNAWLKQIELLKQWLQGI